MENVSNFDKLTKLIVSTCSESIDPLWIKRRRNGSTLSMVHTLFQLVCRDSSLAGSLVDGVLSGKSMSPSAFSRARRRFSWRFLRLLFNLIFSFFHNLTSYKFLWHGRRIFAVDGSRFTMPINFRALKYILKGKSYYPYATVSILYQLISEVPFDMVFSRHSNERASALRHLKKLRKADVVVYDRGYFSFELLADHVKRQVDVVFRLSKTAFKGADEFFQSRDHDRIISVTAGKKRFPSGLLNIRLEEILTC